jgi:hypothetical protein
MNKCYHFTTKIRNCFTKLPSSFTVHNACVATQPHPAHLYSPCMATACCPLPPAPPDPDPDPAPAPSSPLIPSRCSTSTGGQG